MLKTRAPAELVLNYKLGSHFIVGQPIPARDVGGDVCHPADRLSVDIPDQADLMYIIRCMFQDIWVLDLDLGSLQPFTNLAVKFCFFEIGRGESYTLTFTTATSRPATRAAGGAGGAAASGWAGHRSTGAAPTRQLHPLRLDRVDHLFDRGRRRLLPTFHPRL